MYKLIVGKENNTDEYKSLDKLPSIQFHKNNT